MATPKRILYIDMDDTLVDFSAKLEQVHPVVREMYRDRDDEIPGVYALAPPVEGALDAFRELSALFEIYILSTGPWKNPAAWQHKVEWVHLHLGMADGTPAYKRLILSHHKELNRGDFLVDDRPCHNGAEAFEGEVIWFGHEGPSKQTEQDPNFGRVGLTTPCKDWEAVVAYLTDRAHA